MLRKFLIPALAVFFLMVLGLAGASGSYLNYLGKSTWTATITESTKDGDVGNTFTITGGISQVGDEFYLFQGYVTIDTDGPYVVSGSGALIGNNLIFTLTASQQHTNSDWRDVGGMHVSLDKSSLSGTFYDIGHDYNRGTKTWDQRYSAGTLVRSGAPIPLHNALSVSPQQLLLLQ